MIYLIAPVRVGPLGRELEGLTWMDDVRRLYETKERDVISDIPSCEERVGWDAIRSRSDGYR